MGVEIISIGAEENLELRRDNAALRQALRFAIDERDFWREQCDREREHTAAFIRRLTDTIREFAV